MKAKKAQAPEKKNLLPLVIILGVLVAAIVAGVILVGRNRTDGGGNYVGSGGQQPQGEEQGPVTVPSPIAKGPEGALVLIEEFGDYQCPVCGIMNPIIERIAADYGNRVRLVFRHYPLFKIHPNANVASRAAIAAGLQGRFWEMHDKLYANQAEWSVLSDPRPKFTEYAQQLGLDVGRFRTDLESRGVGMRIYEDQKRGDSFRINGTPTIILHRPQAGTSRVLTADQTLKEENLRAEIERELSVNQ